MITDKGNENHDNAREEKNQPENSFWFEFKSKHTHNITKGLYANGWGIMNSGD